MRDPAVRVPRPARTGRASRLCPLCNAARHFGTPGVGLARIPRWGGSGCCCCTSPARPRARRGHGMVLLCPVDLSLLWAFGVLCSEVAHASVHLGSVRSLLLFGISCSAVLRCRRPDHDSSFVRSWAARLDVRGMGVGRDAAVIVSVRERSWIRIQRWAPCLAAANRRWVHPFTRAWATLVVSRCSPSVARAAYPLGGDSLASDLPLPTPPPSLWRGGGPRAVLERPWRGVQLRPSVPTGCSCLRELSWMRWMHRVGFPPAQVPSLGRPGIISWPDATTSAHPSPPPSGGRQG